MLKKYIKGNASNVDKAIVEQAYNHMEKDMPSLQVSEEEMQHIGKKIYDNLPVSVPKIKTYKRWYFSSAAAILMLFSVWLLLDTKSKDDYIKYASVEEIYPRGKAAIAILPSGERIQLDSIKTGIEMTLEGLVYSDGSHISSSDNWSLAKNDMIEIITPAGTQYSIKLEDGTIVWLNAGSSLRYPSHFDESERLVELDGEAFFEVQPQSIVHSGESLRKPFIVQTASQIIHVLGTAFNVYDYSQESASRTTILNGKVSVVYPNKNQEVFLLPNEQSTLKQGNVYKEKVDANLVAQWRNGFLSFDEASLQEVATYLSRWYDLEVIVKGKTNDDKFQGRISNKEPLSKILRILHEANVKYQLDKNVLTLHL